MEKVCSSCFALEERRGKLLVIFIKNIFLGGFPNEIYSDASNWRARIITNSINPRREIFPRDNNILVLIEEQNFARATWKNSSSNKTIFPFRPRVRARRKENDGAPRFCVILIGGSSLPLHLRDASFCFTSLHNAYACIRAETSSPLCRPCCCWCRSDVSRTE